MSLYREAVGSSINRESAERFQGTYSKDHITPLFPPDTPVEELPVDLANLLTDRRYPLLTTLHHKLDPVIAVIDSRCSEASLEDRLNVLIALLWTINFRVPVPKGPPALRISAAMHSLNDISLVLGLSIDQTILRKDSASGDAQFEKFFTEVEEEDYSFLKRRQPKQK